MKKYKKITAILIIIGMCGVGYWYWQSNTTKPDTNMPVTTAKIGEKTFRLYTPRTVEQKQRGLAAFSRLDDDQGMLFRGDDVGVQSFWMKDMKFNIDIIWIDTSDAVTYIAYDISYDSYPKSFRNPPDRPSAYAIELLAGSAEKNSIIPGTKVVLQQ